jgi:hypothetical protein
MTDDLTEALRPLMTEILDLLVEDVPDGWQGLDFSLATAGSVSTADLIARGDGGAAVQVIDFSPMLFMRLMELRTLTAQPGRGAWFTCRITVHQDRSLDIDYDYDSRPEIDPAPAPESYVEDLGIYPRDGEHIPDWLSRELEAAGQP